jgi:hypothetical protein
MKMNCVGCRKPLKKGEFVVLNGGAMVKMSKTGAMMGDKNLKGFLSVHNHFDSKKKYQTMVIADKGPNGQFEFYACSHKCLVDFLTRPIMHLKKITEYKKIIIYSQTKTEKVGEHWWREVISRMGFEGSLITDESAVFDFIGSFEDPKQEEKFLQKISKKLGFPVKANDRIWQLAKKLKENTKISL